MDTDAKKDARSLPKYAGLADQERCVSLSYGSIQYVYARLAL